MLIVPKLGNPGLEQSSLMPVLKEKFYGFLRVPILWTAFKIPHIYLTTGVNLDLGQNTWYSWCLLYAVNFSKHFMYIILILKTTLSVGAIIIPMFQMRKLRHIECFQGCSYM